MGQIHRFHDLVGLWAGSGQTAYLDVGVAETVAEHLAKVCRSIRREPFTASSGNTLGFATADTTHGKRKLDRRPDGSTVEPGPVSALARAARDMIDAYGGDVPVWLASEVAAIEAALAEIEPPVPAAAPVEPAKVYAFTEETCPSRHWNDGSDICADCGTFLG